MKQFKFTRNGKTIRIEMPKTTTEQEAVNHFNTVFSHYKTHKEWQLETKRPQYYLFFC